MKYIICLAYWITSSWMMHDWHNTFGSFEDCPWPLVSLGYFIGILWFVIIDKNPEWRAERGR